MMKPCDQNSNKQLGDPKVRLRRKNAFDASLVFGTSRFDKETGRLDRQTKPFLWAIDKQSGLIKENLTLSRVCPVCGVGAEETLFIKDGFRHVTCGDCGMIFVNPILRQEPLEEYWREEKAWMNVLDSAPQLELDRLKFCYGLDLVENRCQGRRLLDIGTGNGTFIRLAQQEGWQAEAVELNKECRENLEREGFKIISQALVDLPPKSYDLISLWEVLEHIADPRSLLEDIGRLLSGEGVLLIMVPNASSLVTRLLHEKSNTFGGHSHVNHFNPQNMCDILDKTGFKVLEMETVITELGAINNYLSFQNPYSGSGESVIAELSPSFIHERMLGSRLLTLAALKA